MWKVIKPAVKGQPKRWFGRAPERVGSGVEDNDEEEAVDPAEADTEVEEDQDVDLDKTTEVDFELE